MSDKLTWFACCFSVNWCIFQGSEAMYWCFLLLSNALLYFESWRIALNQPDHIGSTYKRIWLLMCCRFIKVVFLLYVRLKLRVSLTHWLCEPLETQDPQSLIYEWRKYCGCTEGGKYSLSAQWKRFGGGNIRLGLFAVYSWPIGQCSVLKYFLTNQYTYWLKQMVFCTGNTFLKIRLNS